MSAISKILNDEMMNICGGLKSNMLALSIAKTNMIMTNQGRKYNAKDCVLTIDGEMLSSVSNTQFVGIILDDKLTWKNHIDYIGYKVSKLAGIFHRVRNLLTKYTLVTLCNTILKPYFTYCIPISCIWSNTCVAIGRSDDCMYIFGYCSWGLCIVRETGHRQWSGVA